MGNSKNTTISPILKSLVVTFFKLVAIVISFTCKIIGLVLTKIGELLEKLTNGNH